MTAAVVIGGMVLPTGPGAAAEETCGGRPVTITATAQNQELQGTDGADVISTAGFRGVKVDGRGGDDVICTRSAHAAVLDGGAGADTLIDVDSGRADSSFDATVLQGGRGADRFVGIAGSSGPPDESSTVLAFSAYTHGVAVDLSAGTVVDAGETDRVEGVHVVHGTNFPDTFVGSALADRYESTSDFPDPRDADVVRAGAGDDEVTAYGGTVHAGPGDDRVTVWTGTAYGEDGDDVISLVGNGRASGGPGDDRIRGGFISEDGTSLPVPHHRFRIDAGPGDDVVEAPASADPRYYRCPRWCARSRLDGGSGADRLDLTRRSVVDLAARRGRLRGGTFSLGSFEHVRGSVGRDVIRGDARRNRLEGRGGADVLVGRGGPDVLRGGAGRDLADGGPGRDRCRAERRRSC